MMPSMPIPPTSRPTTRSPTCSGGREGSGSRPRPTAGPWHSTRNTPGPTSASPGSRSTPTTWTAPWPPWKRRSRSTRSFLDGLCLIGQTLSRKGRYHEAIAPLKQALEVDSKHAEAQYRLAEAYYGTGEWRKALEPGLEATRLQRNYHAAEVVVADSYSKLGKVTEARTWYNKAKQDARFRDWCELRLQELDRQQY